MNHIARWAALSLLACLQVIDPLSQFYLFFCSCSGIDMIKLGSMHFLSSSPLILLLHLPSPAPQRH